LQLGQLTAPKVFLFDIGNVLVRWDPANLYRHLFDTEAEMQAFFNTCCTRPWHVEHDRGRSMDAGAALLLGKFPHWQAQILAWKTRWSEMFDGPMPGMPELLKELHQQGYPLYALTNMSAEVMPDLRHTFPFLSLFRDILVSGEQGVLKPDPKIFALSLAQMQTDPDQILFIDDVEENILAAKALGFQTHLFTDCQGLRKELQNRNVTLSPKNPISP
jgi:HAD superfamily hydrolase (TIGR01509 family)